MDDKEIIKKVIDIIVNHSKPGDLRPAACIDRRWFFTLYKELVESAYTGPDFKMMAPTVARLNKVISELIDDNEEIFSIYGITSLGDSPQYQGKLIKWETANGLYI